MTRLNIILLCTLCVLIGWHLGWRFRGVGEEMIITRETDRRLTKILENGIRSGLLMVNDDLLFDRAGIDVSTNMVMPQGQIVSDASFGR